jgi:NAD(P)-dependent dehydrogenase (short-subunit alcohol dehydrogenase family)
MELTDRTVLVIGGSRGFGLGAVEALVDRGARVTVLARDPATLADVARRLGVRTIAGDATDPALAERTLRELQPHVTLLTAGATPRMASIEEQTWESFAAVWDTDVRATFHWVRAALRTNLPPGARVLIGSSGAAINGSPLSGGYSGAKRMQWLMADYAQQAATRLGRDLRFQALVPRQISGDTDLGRSAAEAYARARGITVEQFLAGFGTPLTARRFGEHVVAILTDPQYRDATAIGIKADELAPL